MKKMNLKKEVFIIAMILISLFVISTIVLATDGPVQIPIGDSNETTENTETTDTNVEAPAGTTNTNQVVPTANQVADTNQNESNLPQTGDASDYAIFMLIIVSVVVAIYAYRKVKEYNIK